MRALRRAAMAAAAVAMGGAFALTGGTAAQAAYPVGCWTTIKGNVQYYANCSSTDVFVCPALHWRDGSVDSYYDQIMYLQPYVGVANSTDTAVWNWNNIADWKFAEMLGARRTTVFC